MHKPDAIQEKALSTWHSDDMPDHLQRLHATLGITGEAGEYAELLKKDTFKPGHVSTGQERLDELGDLLYYVAILAHMDGATIEQVAQMNGRKLEGGHGWEPDNVNCELVRKT